MVQGKLRWRVDTRGIMAAVASGKMDVAPHTLQGVELLDRILMLRHTLTRCVALRAELPNGEGVDTSCSCITCNDFPLLSLLF